MRARQVVAVGCVLAGGWLLVIGVVYLHFVAIAVAVVAVVFGIAGLVQNS